MANLGNSFFTNLVDHTQAITFFCVVLILLILLKACYNFRTRREDSRNTISFRFEEQNGLGLPIMGLNIETIEALPEFVYSNSQSFKEPPECAVCLSEFEENEKGRLLPNCNHRFHKECIDMWFYSHSTCPLCRTRVQSNGSSEEPNSSNIARSHPNFVYGHLVSGQRSSGAVQYPNSSEIVLWVGHDQQISGRRILPQFALQLPNRSN
ncbi:hypothetical protein SUGI_0786180 [Cryptomeria japonica]|uniref:RING-H2 finger protein ATL2 n=1 Tax=Cryptomeria japonica TaxID=3369 RepID=UPI0024149AC2|nr:RING-H2 finger protein ATL2 [Cryptomeria japonica]GLJ38558.1 hypothetical protein SUGI_0786180 [Cryptomeria japonica]